MTERVMSRLRSMLRIALELPVHGTFCGDWFVELFVRLLPAKARARVLCANLSLRSRSMALLIA